MTRIQQSLRIDAPIEVISAYASDPRHLPEWNQMIERVWDIQATPEIVGTTWKVAVKVIGAEQQVVARINFYEPPGRFGVELVGGVPGLPGLTATLVVEVRSTRSSPIGAPSQQSADDPDIRSVTLAPGSALANCTLNIHFPMRIGGTVLGALVAPLINEQIRQGLLALKRILETPQLLPQDRGGHLDQG